MLVWALAIAFVEVVTVMAIRGIVPAFGVQSADALEALDSLSNLFGVALGYALGALSSKK